MRVLLLSRYSRMGASSRYRAYQYLPYLQENGFDVKVSPFQDDEYLRDRYEKRRGVASHAIRAYYRRIATLLKSRQYDLVWIQKEALPWVPGWLEAPLIPSCPPVVVDYDDAVFHRYDRHPSAVVRVLLGERVDREMRKASLVVAGNQYLASRARIAGAQHVEILPTVIDLDRYPPVQPSMSSVFTIGWIGTPQTAGYLEDLRPVLRELCHAGNARVLAIGAGPLHWDEIPIEVRPWSEASEVASLQEIDVGIMPVPDSHWERGKCGLKLLQYMAVGRPVVASPVGVNTEIVRDGANGFLASTLDEWFHALRTLSDDPVRRDSMGQAARALVEEKYCLRDAAPKLAHLMMEVQRTITTCDCPRCEEC